MEIHKSIPELMNGTAKYLLTNFWKANNEGHNISSTVLPVTW